MLLTEEHCYECGKTTSHHNSKCSVCESKAENKEHQKYLAELDALTMEQRVRRIEEALYRQAKEPWVDRIIG